MKVLIPLALACVMLAGCSTNGNNVSRAESMKVTTANIQNQHWVEGFQQAVKGAFSGMYSFKGKTCSLRLNLDRNARFVSAWPESGDKDLCEAAITALAYTQYPFFVNDEQYRLFRSVPIDINL